MTGDAVGHANQLVAVLEARGREIWGAGWAWIEEADRFEVFPGEYRSRYDVRARFFAPTEDVCELLLHDAEASDDPVRTLRNGDPKVLDLDVRGKIECAVFDRRELTGSLCFPVMMTDIVSLRFNEPFLELQFTGQGCPEIQALLSRRRA